MVAGGQEGLLNVIDLRLQEHQGIVWQGTHGGSVLDAQFSPFIPFWLASAGDDGVVDIWDLRATCHKPLAKIDGHLGPVTSVRMYRATIFHRNYTLKTDLHSRVLFVGRLG